MSIELIYNYVTGALVGHLQPYPAAHQPMSRRQKRAGR